MKSFQNSKNILPYDGTVFISKGIFKKSFNLDLISNDILWRNDKIKMFGKIFDQPRKVAWYGDENVLYNYSGIEMKSKYWTKSLYKIKNILEEEYSLLFNSVLVNLYRNGDDYMSYHQDNEPELGNNPTLASISFGAERDFLFKHIERKEVIKVSLGDGDLLVMGNETQRFWKHSIPKRKKVHSPRLNLTFRNIIN